MPQQPITHWVLKSLSHYVTEVFSWCFRGLFVFWYIVVFDARLVKVDMPQECWGRKGTNLWQPCAVLYPHVFQLECLCESLCCCLVMRLTALPFRRQEIGSRMSPWALSRPGVKDNRIVVTVADAPVSSEFLSSLRRVTGSMRLLQESMGSQRHGFRQQPDTFSNVFSLIAQIVQLMLAGEIILTTGSWLVCWSKCGQWADCIWQQG